MNNSRDFCGAFRVRLKANGDYLAEQLDVDNQPIPGKSFSSEHWPIFERELRMRLRTGRRDPVRKVLQKDRYCPHCRAVTLAGTRADISLHKPGCPNARIIAGTKPDHCCMDETATVVNGNWICQCPKG